MANENEVNEFAAESQAAENQSSEQKQANAEAQEETFGAVEGEDAFGLAQKKETPKAEEKVEKKAEEKSEAKSEDKTVEKKEETKEQAETKDDLIEKLKLASPEFKELSEKKSFKNIGEVVKAYHELEKLHGSKANQLSTFRKALDKYCTFDNDGNISGYSEFGKQALALLEKGKGEEGKTASEINKQAGDILSPEQITQLEAIKEKFFDMFEKNPVEAIVRIAMGITQHNLKGAKEEFSKPYKDLEEKLKPIFEEREERKMLSTIDEVAKEQIANGDTKANEFIDEYAPEIEAELKKIDLEFRKSNPKLAIQQAYLIVKDKKVEEFKKQIKEKTDAEQKKAQAAAESGASSNGGAEPEAPEEIAGMLDALKSKSDGSVF